MMGHEGDDDTQAFVDMMRMVTDQYVWKASRQHPMMAYLNEMLDAAADDAIINVIDLKKKDQDLQRRARRLIRLLLIGPVDAEVARLIDNDDSRDDDKSPPFSAAGDDDDSVRVRGLNDLTINAVRSEAIRAHLKHHRPDKNSGSLLDNGLTILARLAALMEEVGEVADELVPAAKAVGDTQLAMLIAQTQLLGEMARKLTYDGGGKPGLTEPGARVLPPSVDRTKLVTELIQVGNVVLSWAQQIEEGGE